MDDALYELANTYTVEEQNDKAIATFDNLINQHKNSAYIAKSILKQGLIFYNGNKEEQSRGILLATILYGIVIVTIKFI